MIFGSNLLDFAIGLVLIFFVLSLFCSFVNERIASTINLRAKTLEDGIEGLVPELAAEILNSPLIRGLSNQHGKNGANAGSWVRGSVHKATSYIDSRTFSTALIHEVLAKAATISPPPTPAAAGASQPVLDLKTLRDAAALLQDDHTRGALLALIDAAQGDFDRAQRGIEKWFDDAMERLSGGTSAVRSCSCFSSASAQPSCSTRIRWRSPMTCGVTMHIGRRLSQRP